MEEQEEVKCQSCGKPTREYCSGLYCRDCHKMESLEDCLADKQVNAIREAYGIPPVAGSNLEP